MKIYILDDDKNTCTKIAQIIEEEDLGNVVEYSQDSRKSLNDFSYFDVDIVIVDLLMPELDGINFVMKAKKINSDVEFIMISQVNNKALISKAYQAGIKFFVGKPINRIEVKHVMENVIELIDYKQKFQYLSHVFNDVTHSSDGIGKTFEDSIKKKLVELGIWGEKGTDEIIELSTYIRVRNISLANITIREIIESITDNPRNCEQRIRRAIGKGLTNLACIGLEDFLNNTFVEYSNTLYDFEAIQKEMDFLRGKSTRRGKISLRKFIDNLINM